MDEREHLIHMRAGARDAHAKEIRHFEEMQVYMADLRFLLALLVLWWWINRGPPEA